jgi:hypothetical protein
VVLWRLRLTPVFGCRLQHCLINQSLDKTVCSAVAGDFTCNEAGHVRGGGGGGKRRGKCVSSAVYSFGKPQMEFFSMPHVFSPRKM